ncbi:MAG TPA: zinc ribbon domain-containing protein [Gemmatimonadaceae bacterium]|nr:zinc ribbon domain-containing protein [Gemmatimonadaceae bacterium]
MDDLDRLAFRVARTVRATYPHLLERGFTLSDLEERLAPYSDARRELADGGPSGYETTLLRLLTGERGYLAAEGALQNACRTALQQPSPALSMVRTWARSALTLRSGAFALVGDPARVAAAAAVEHAASQSASGRSEAVTPSSDLLGGATVGCDCVYCGGGLPMGRNVRFCPHCGLDLTVRQCPACSTELDREWRFCVTCGRQSDDDPVTDRPDTDVGRSGHLAAGPVG